MKPTEQQLSDSLLNDDALFRCHLLDLFNCTINYYGYEFTEDEEKSLCKETIDFVYLKKDRFDPLKGKATFFFTTTMCCFIRHFYLKKNVYKRTNHGK